jgi:macrolide transport system ATP-binding/permease protein
MEQLLRDLRYAFRMMAGHRFFTAMAALSLALGIGANTAIYSFLDSILMRALPVQDPESLVVFNWRAPGKTDPDVAHSFSGSLYTEPGGGVTSGNFPYPTFDLFRQSPLFRTVFAFRNAGRLNVQIEGQADLADAQYVSGGYFSGLGVPPAAGRLIDRTDDAGGVPVAVLSFRYAQKHFADPTKAAGRSIRLNNLPFTVVGVAAPGFFGVNPAGEQDIFLPLRASAALNLRYADEEKTKYSDNHFYWLEMMGRLQPGVPPAQAQASLAPAFHNFVAASAENAKERATLPELTLRPGAGGLDSLRRQFSRPLYVLMTMVALILAIACANIANLLLARAAGRRREIAVRLSLGAGRMRIVRQLLTESVLLASIGGALGVAFAAWGIRALTLLIANGRQNFTLHASLNWHVLGVTLALSLATGLLFGLAPALQATRVDLVSALKQTRAGQVRLRLRSWFKISLSQALVVSQIAISLLLLVAAGLFVRTLMNLNSIQLGFNSERLLLVTLDASQAGYKSDALFRFYGNLADEMAAIPGVRAVTLSDYALLSGSRSGTGVTIPGRTDKNMHTSVVSIGPAFFSTMQIPILLGREIARRDGSSDHVAVVNEVFAKRFFPGENPIGRHFQLGTKDHSDIEIVGISKTARLNTLKQDVPEVVYVPYQQNPWRSLGQVVFELRAAGDPMSIAATAREVVRRADARIPISNIVTQEKQIDQTIVQERTFATLCTAFAVLAVLIACIGLYGTMAYSVARRTNEIGIRMALGAERRRLIWMVLREVLVMAAAGLAIGLPVALAASKVVQSFLFQMKPNDPAAIIGAALLLILASAAAGYGPAYRAARIDPWTALRDE